MHFINNPGDKDLTKDLEKLGITCISTVHDLHPHESKKEWYKELRFKLIYKRLHENIVYAKNLITNSETQYEELKSSYPDKKIYYHSFPSLVTENIKNGKDMPLELETIDKPYILFFGRIEEYKGITLLYKVFTESIELSEHYTLVIAGRGTLPFTRIPNEKNVIIINRYIKDTEIAYMYQHAHCTVYPYISATQSGVLSLSFYFQTPTLTSDVPFFKKIIATSGVGMLFKNGNYNDLKSKLSQVCQSDMKAMTENGKKYYDTHYEGSVIRKKLIEWRCLYGLYTQFVLGCDINPSTKIGTGFKIFHSAHASVVSPGTIIGNNNVSLRQNTTIGAKGFDGAEKSPIIEDNVTIGPNVCIIGDITIGEGTIIGAGAVVVKDVPAHTIVVGNPAKVIKSTMGKDTLNKHKAGGG